MRWSPVAKSAAMMLWIYLAPAAAWADPETETPPNSASTAKSPPAQGTTKTPKQEADDLLRSLERKEVPKFIRVKRNAKGEPISLQTATVRYVPEDGRELFIDLVGVVHVADRGYYQQFNDQFEQYEALLYELVAPQGTTPTKGKKSENPVAIAQQFLKSLLDLEHQMDTVDYTAKNFVHADLSPDEMAKIMRERGDNALTLTLGVASDFLRASNLAELKQKQQRAGGLGDDVKLPETPEEMAAFLLNPVKLKRIMAKQFDTMEGDAPLGNTLDQILVRDRNQACMSVLQQQLEQGRKKIGIFYGAAHLPDLEQRLLAKYKLKKQSVTWHTAWDLRERGEPGVGDVLRLLKPLLED